MNRVEEFPQVPQSVPLFDTKTWIILLLLVLLAFSFLGKSLGERLDLLWEYIAKILADLGFYSGILLNRSADVAADTAKGGVDIAEGAVKNMGNILIGPSPEPDSTSNPIQNPISSTKTNWCLVGEYQNKRGCVPVTESDTCLSGQVFPTQKMCLNPNIG